MNNIYYEMLSSNKSEDYMRLMNFEGAREREISAFIEVEYIGFKEDKSILEVCRNEIIKELERNGITFLEQIDNAILAFYDYAVINYEIIDVRNYDAKREIGALIMKLMQEKSVDVYLDFIMEVAKCLELDINENWIVTHKYNIVKYMDYEEDDISEEFKLSKDQANKLVQFFKNTFPVSKWERLDGITDYDKIKSFLNEYEVN